ncbi:glycosyltransferase family 2 protein [Snodgrassella alvi]|uniref:glycosyltransferase family 2 protein n=1 Tax=Snodgrassella alvi TaxID=1196083 RepID=UPI0034614A88
MKSIDVIIPCYNAENTLARAIDSVLVQPELGCLWLVDDASADGTASLIRQWQLRHPQLIRSEFLPTNRGPAVARNWAALMSSRNHIAFLDADDAYQPHALQAASAVFRFRPQTGLLRLPVKGHNIPERYREHEKFAVAWRTFEMITATNTVFNRAYFLACGGFPVDALFRQLGGEDGALGLATIESCMVATLFDEAGMPDIGVDFYGHEGMYVRKLLDAMLYGQKREECDDTAMQQADAVTQSIVQRLHDLHEILAYPHPGKQPLKLFTD